MKLHIRLLLFLACIIAVFPAAAQTRSVTVRADQPGAAISATMWGIFFEDINLAADGGLYAELVKNRSFEFSIPMMGWTELRSKGTVGGSMLVINRASENKSNPRFLRVKNAASGSYGLNNEGFRGMGVFKDGRYDFSVWAKPRPDASLKMRVELVNAKGEVIGSATVAPSGGAWKKYTASFTCSATDQKAQLNIWFEGNGSIDIDMVSLFPQDTWKKRPGGLRADLVQLLADLHPGFLRFPGGCIVEGRDLANRYQWKKTVGKVEERELIINRWNTEFDNRSAPDYFQSFGLGFFEYFQLAEDLGASPLPILNCGMACQFNTAEVVATDDLDPYIQDALDLIEFANGPVTSRWGKLRASMGHPAPFHLKMMGVGNEQWGPQYIERFTLFAKAIKQKYPSIQLVNSVGPYSGGELFNFLNDTLRKMHADILDEHYYRAPEWFLKQAKRYDNYDRSGPRIFAGEYAAHSADIPNGKTKNNWRSALAEAAFMTGLERNADIVRMASYAPLLAHIDGWQWSPDLIWFDNLQSYGTPNYYIQKLFANHRGTQVVPVQMNGEVMAGKDSLYASACIDKPADELIIKIANTIGNPQDLALSVAGVKDGKVKVTTIGTRDMNAVNSFEQPLAVAPVNKEAEVKDGKIYLTLDAYSFSVLRVRMR